MNQKDYKEIAGIIRETNTDNSNCVICPLTKQEIANKLADYFEREVKTRWEEVNKRALKRGVFLSGIVWLKDNDFNRQQFLKDAGVE